MKYILALIALAAAFFGANKLGLLDKIFGEKTEPSSVPPFFPTQENPVLDVENYKKPATPFVVVEVQNHEPGDVANALRKFAADLDIEQAELEKSAAEEEARILAEKQRKMTPNANDAPNPTQKK